MRTRVFESFVAARARMARMARTRVARVTMAAAALAATAAPSFATSSDTSVTPFDPGVDVGGTITGLGTYFANNLGPVFGVFIGLVAFGALWAWGRRATKGK